MAACFFCPRSYGWAHHFLSPAVIFYSVEHALYSPWHHSSHSDQYVSWYYGLVSMNTGFTFERSATKPVFNVHRQLTIVNRRCPKQEARLSAGLYVRLISYLVSIRK